MTSEQMKAARAKLGLSQPQFATAIGMSSAAVKAWERGANPVPLSVKLLTNHLLREHDRKQAAAK